MCIQSKRRRRMRMRAQGRWKFQQTSQQQSNHRPPPPPHPLLVGWWTVIENQTTNSNNLFVMYYTKRTAHSFLPSHWLAWIENTALNKNFCKNSIPIALSTVNLSFNEICSTYLSNPLPVFIGGAENLNIIRHSNIPERWFYAPHVGHVKLHLFISPYLLECGP